MTSAPSKLYSDDVSLVVVLLDANPFFWGGAATIPFAKFLNHMIPFLNSLLLVNQLNQVVLIATGVNSCGYIYDSEGGQRGSEGGKVAAVASEILQKLEEFVEGDRKKIGKEKNGAVAGSVSSLLSRSLSLALCYIQRVFRSGALHPQPRILCLQGSPDGPEQYVAVMNAIFSAQRSMVPIDSCVVGAQHSAFLQQASNITGGVYLKPQQLEGLFQYLVAVFATDLQSRSFLQLPKPVGVDFRASCFCHKKTIDMGYVCSVCLSIFCKHHKKCSVGLISTRSLLILIQHQNGKGKFQRPRQYGACHFSSIDLLSNVRGTTCKSLSNFLTLLQFVMPLYPALQNFFLGICG